jgi:hypothetical protein
MQFARWFEEISKAVGIDRTVDSDAQGVNFGLTSRFGNHETGVHCSTASGSAALNEK